MENDLALAVIESVVSTLQTELGNTELQAQTILTLLTIMRRKEMPMSDLEKVVGVSQAAISRNISRLSRGLPPAFAGPGVIEAFEDPYYRKRKIVQLTAKGETLRKKLGTVMSRACK